MPLHDALQIHKDGLKDLVVQGLLLRRGVRKQAQKGCELQVSPSLCPVHMQRHLAALSTTQACCSHREDVLQTSSGDFFWTSAGPQVLAGARGHSWRQDCSRDPAGLPQCGWHSVRQLSLHTGSIPICRILSASTKTLRHAKFTMMLFWCVNNNSRPRQKKKKGKILSLVWHQLAENILFASPSLLQQDQYFLMRSSSHHLKRLLNSVEA